MTIMTQNKNNTIQKIKDVTAHNLMDFCILIHRYKRHKFVNSKSKSMHHGQGWLLCALSHKQQVLQKDILKHSWMSKQCLTQLLDKLEKDGCIKRKQSEKDKREMYINITPKGTNEVNKMKSIKDKEHGVILNCLNDNEITNLNLYISKINNNLFKLTKSKDSDIPKEMFQKFLKHNADSVNKEWIKRSDEHIAFWKEDK
ncbi:MAG: hypothetical protein Ta2E_07340 [Mycoplasmoidaceae bacterium]|nr:MAG: hypothetical protein Ta2E_07340 [Mycoplasmoidaceae bacterium]